MGPSKEWTCLMMEQVAGLAPKLPPGPVEASLQVGPLPANGPAMEGLKSLPEFFFLRFYLFSPGWCDSVD